MKNIMGPLALAMALVGASSFAQITAHWANRPQVIIAAQRLATEIEHLDEALHDANAPAHFIQKVHHTEETVKEFAKLVQAPNSTYADASAEFTHIRRDVLSIRNEIEQHPNLLQFPAVSREWRGTWTAYRELDHEMYHHLTSRWTPEAVAQLEQDLKDLETLHE